MPKLDDAINVQYLPYAVCAAVSLLLYVIHLSQSGETTQTDYILGAILFAACVLLFALHWKQDKQAIEDNWRKVLKVKRVLLQGRYTMPLKANTEKQNERKRCSSLYRTALLPLTAAGEATLTVGKDR